MKTYGKIISNLVLAIIAVFQLSAAQGLEGEKNSYQSKSPSGALLCSFLTTTIPVLGGIKLATAGELGDGEMALIYGGLIVGPAAGYFYGECPLRGLGGIAIRGGTAALTVYAAQSAAEAHKDDGMFGGLEEAIQVGIVGTVIIVIESVVDIALVHQTVNKNNIEKAQQQQAHVTLLPAYFADSGASGLELNITF